MAAMPPSDASSPIDRRAFLGVAAAASFGGLLAACTSGGDSSVLTPTTGPPPPPGSLAKLAAGLQQVSAVAPEAPVQTGPQIFTYALIDSQGNDIEGASVQLYAAITPDERAIGPFDGTWHAFDAYAATKDESPKSALYHGVYVSSFELPRPGRWTLLATTTVEGVGVGGTTILPATHQDVEAALGSRAISVRTPVATTPHATAEICTRKPPCPLHAISLDDALKNGKPTVVNFGTPLLCQVQLCGPVLDETMVVAQAIGDRANFIHVEEFLPGKDLKPPTVQSLKTVSPAFRAWGFRDEPWVIAIDPHGTIRGRLGPGGTVAAEIEQVLRPLL
jgi:hypothetical protein